MLHAQPRKPESNLGAERRAGKIPAIVYGRGVPSVPVLVDAQAFLKFFKTGGEGSLIDFQISDGEPFKAVLQARQMHPVKREYLHLDFYRIRMDEKMRTKVQLVFVGEAPAVKIGGVLVKNKDHIEIECLPKDLVPRINVDLSGLSALHASIKVRDLPALPDVALVAHPDDIIATISQMKEEVEDAATAAAKEKEQIEKLGTKPEEQKDEEPVEGKTKAKEKDKK